MPNGRLPSGFAGPARNSCSKTGITSSAICPTPEPIGSVGTGRQPSSVRPSSAMIRSANSLAAARTAVVGRQEGQPDGVGLPVPRVGTDRQLEPGGRTEQLVRHLDQDAGAVTDRRVGTGRAAMVEVDQRGHPVVHDGVAAPAFDVGHRGNAAGVTLELWVVQPLGGGCCRVLHGRPPVVGGVTASRRLARWTSHIGHAGYGKDAGMANTAVTCRVWSGGGGAPCARDRTGPSVARHRHRARARCRSSKWPGGRPSSPHHTLRDHRTPGRRWPSTTQSYRTAPADSYQHSARRRCRN